LQLDEFDVDYVRGLRVDGEQEIEVGGDQKYKENAEESETLAHKEKGRDKNDSYGRHSSIPSALPSGSPSEIIGEETSGSRMFQHPQLDQSKSEKVSNSSPNKIIGFSSSISMLFLIMLFARRRRNRRTQTKMQNMMEGGLSTGIMEDEVGLAASHGASDVEHGKSILAGAYKLTKSYHLNEFLEALGVSWTARSAACSARPVHTIHHDVVNHTVVMKFKGVPRFTYQLSGYGGTTTNKFLERIFACRAMYLADKCGFEVFHRGVDEGPYDLHLKWQRNINNDDDATVQLIFTAFFPYKPPVRCIQVYRQAVNFSSS
jgi:hypothetical protein